MSLPDVLTSSINLVGTVIGSLSQVQRLNSILVVRLYQRPTSTHPEQSAMPLSISFVIFWCHQTYGNFVKTGSTPGFLFLWFLLNVIFVDDSLWAHLLHNFICMYPQTAAASINSDQQSFSSQSHNFNSIFTLCCLIHVLVRHRHRKRIHLNTVHWPRPISSSCEIVYSFQLYPKKWVNFRNSCSERVYTQRSSVGVAICHRVFTDKETNTKTVLRLSVIIPLSIVALFSGLTIFSILSKVLCIENDASVHAHYCLP